MTEEQRAARLVRARFWIRAEFGIAIGAVLATAFLWLAQPDSCLCPMFYEPPPRLQGFLVMAVAIAGIVIGFAAMWRLSRLDPERGERTWRYRR